MVSGAFTDLAGWKASTISTADPDGDLGAVTTAPVFNDPSRDIESYAATLGIASFDDFIAALYNQSKANWDPRLTAHAVNNYLRRGFNLEPVQGNDVADGLVARWSFDHNAGRIMEPPPAVRCMADHPLRPLAPARWR